MVLPAGQLARVAIALGFSTERQVGHQDEEWQFPSRIQLHSNRGA